MEEVAGVVGEMETAMVARQGTTATLVRVKAAQITGILTPVAALQLQIKGNHTTPLQSSLECLEV
jgi:hypothetical protein